MVVSPTLAANDSALFDDPQLFRSTVGSLQYLVNTRPDICFSVSKLSQSLSAHTVLHWESSQEASSLFERYS